MFDEAFEKLDIDAVAIILDELNKQVEGSLFDPLETVILAIELPFYKDYRFLNIADYASHPPLQRYAFQKNGTSDLVVIDWRYETIYQLNHDAQISLDEKNIKDYVRFYFNYVKGRHGKFVVCESSDHVTWKDEPPAEVRKSLNDALKPLELLEKRKDGVFVLKAFMMLKDTLFSVRIYVDKTGRVTMDDHEILIDDVPVLDSTVGYA